MPRRLRNLDDEIKYIKKQLYPGYSKEFRKTTVFRVNDHRNNPRGYPGDKVIFEKYITNQHMIPEFNAPPTHRELVSIWKNIDESSRSIADDTSYMTISERKYYLDDIRRGYI